MLQWAPAEIFLRSREGANRLRRCIAEKETPQASSEVMNWEGVSPSPADYRVWGSRELPASGVWVRAPAEKEFGTALVME